MAKVKAKKEKTQKAPKKSKKEIEPPMMPTIIEGLAKLVERLEILERKVDQVNSRISNALFEIRDVVQQSSRQNASHQQNPYGYSQPPQHHSAPQRTMYQVICADCKKNTEVPFKPGDRPVYCKECFSARKSGNPASGQSKAPVAVLAAPVKSGKVKAEKPKKQKK